MTGYTTRQVAEILGLPPWRVRRWARSGLLEPGRGARGEYRFAFRDVVLLRAVRDLEAAEVPTRRVRRALRERDNPYRSTSLATLGASLARTSANTVPSASGPPT